MAVLWVIEKPRPGSRNLPDLLQGDFAVRAFASIRSFLRLISVRQGPPDLLLIRSADFSEDLINFQHVIALRWPEVNIVYLGGQQSSEPDEPRVWYLTEGSWDNLPFLLQQILTRSEISTPHFLQWGDICLDFERQQFRILPQGSWEKLPPKEFQLLRVFLKHPEHCLSHEDLNAGVWQGIKVSQASVASHISRLRRSLSPSSYQIKSVYGGGYRLQKSQND